MDLQQLRFLVTVSKTLNFSKAAEELFISQPTLSNQIRRLEEELGVKLLERSTRNVALTPVGRECVNIAQQIVDLSDQIVQIAQGEDDMIIYPSKLHGASLDGHHDHRIVMATACAALGAEGDSFICDAESVNVSFPRFFEEMRNIKATIERLSEK